MQANYQQRWCFALSGARRYVPVIGIKPGMLRRTLRRVGGQFLCWCDLIITGRNRSRHVRRLFFSIAALASI